MRTRPAYQPNHLKNMTSRKQLRSPVLAVAAFMAIAFAFGSGGVAHAQTTYTGPNGAVYTVPAGYNTYGSYGAYYNSSTGTYFNPVTGQYSTTAPVGRATLGNNGTYTIPAGFTTSVYGTYYNPATGQYYDPLTGFYSTSMPVGPSYYNSTANTGTTGTVYYVNPGLPNTGAGGASAETMAFLAVAALLSFAGMVIVSRKLFV
jgi:hypothetical protein